MKNRSRFYQILEEVQAMNSEKETRLKDYNDKLAYYNSKKSSFMSIINGKKQDQWEAEAQKIINGNVYLSKKWGIDKAQHNIDDATKKTTSGELTQEEIRDINAKLLKDKQDLQKDKQELDALIRNDLKKIQTT